MTAKTHCDPITQITSRGGLGPIWPHIFCSVNTNAPLTRTWQENTPSMRLVRRSFASRKWLCPDNLYSGIACTCILVLETFVFLASPCEPNLAFVWWQTDVMTVRGALWPSSGSDIGSNEIWTQVVSWTPWRCLIGTGVNGDVSRLSTTIRNRLKDMAVLPHLLSLFLCHLPAPWGFGQ